MDVSSKTNRCMSSRSTNLISEDTTSKNFYLKRKEKSTAYLDCDDQHGSDKNARKTRSQEEKRRRDKMNNFIGELAALVPTSNSRSGKRDKLSVLRMAVQHMKMLRGLVSNNPAFLSDEEIKHLLQRAADGFLFVADCDRGKILFVSESVHKILNYSKNNLIGQSLFDYVHPKDIAKVKEQLSSAVTVPQEELTDAKSCPLVKTDIHPSYLRLCSGMRRSFFCRMKCNRNMEDENFLSSCFKKNAGHEAFCTIHSTGYLKSWSSAEVNLDENNEPDNDGCILSCLVAVGRSHTHTVSQPVWSHVKVKPVEFVSRQDIDGKFVFVDQRTTAILAYLPQELLGTSFYEYVHEDDIAHLAECHRRVLQMREKINTNCYKLKIKDGSFITLRSCWFTFMNPWTKEVEYIVSTSTVVMSSGDRPEISCHLSGASPHTTATVLKPGEGKLGLQTVPGIPGGTRAGTGKTGQTISEKQLEIQSSGEPAEGESGEHGQREGQRQAQDYSTTQEEATSAQEKDNVLEALEAAQEVYVEGSGPQASGQGQAEEVKT